MARDRDRGCAVVTAVLKIEIPLNAGSFLTR